MKKILIFLLTVILVLSFAGCGIEDGPKKETIGTSSVEKVTEEKFLLNETAVFEDLKITATEIKETSGESFFEPEEGNVFVGINFTIENISSETQTISSLLLFEAYADDIKCDYSFTAACAFDNGTLDGELAAGKKMVGWYAVEVPRDWSNIEIEGKSSWLSDNSAKFVFEK